MPPIESSLAALQEKIRSSTSLSAAFERLLLDDHDYEGWVQCIHRHLAWIARDFAQNPELRNQSEDEISIQVVTLLRQMDLTADHESKVGGHCDIKVMGSLGKQWLAEAKIKDDSYGYDWLLKGIKQLLTRYTTGEAMQTAGGFLIYCKQPRVDRVMERWQEKLADEGFGPEFPACALNTLGFHMAFEHNRTGRDCSVWHLPFNLRFQPEA